MTAPLPPLPEGLGPTLETLHVYAKAIGAIARAFAIPQRRWAHISLSVRPDGLVSSGMPLPDGRSLGMRMDLRTHEVVVDSTVGTEAVLPMAEGWSGAMMGARMLEVASQCGLVGDVDRTRFESDEEGVYLREHAEGFFTTLTAVTHVLTAHRAGLSGEVGPIQLWPHGFDVAFEWFGTRMVPAEEPDAEPQHAQLNLGFYPFGSPYFYSTPWPLDRRLLAVPLPAGAEWHTEGWEGSILPYDEVAGRPDGRDRVAEYARAVFELAAPTLTRV